MAAEDVAGPPGPAQGGRTVSHDAFVCSAFLLLYFFLPPWVPVIMSHDNAVLTIFVLAMSFPVVYAALAAHATLRWVQRIWQYHAASTTAKVAMVDRHAYARAILDLIVLGSYGYYVMHTAPRYTLYAFAGAFPLVACCVCQQGRRVQANAPPERAWEDA